MNQSAANFKVVRQPDPSAFTKVIDHNKIYVKRNSNNSLNFTQTNTVNPKGKKEKEKERLYELLKTKQEERRSNSKPKALEKNQKIGNDKANYRTETEASLKETQSNAKNNEHKTQSEKYSSKFPSEFTSKRNEPIDKTSSIRESKENSHTKGDEHSEEIRQLKEENRILKERIENLIKDKENNKMMFLRTDSIKEHFCNEAKDFLEYLRTIDKTFSFNYAILEPNQFNESQLSIYFKNLKQNIQPIKRILEETQEELRTIKLENENLLRRVGNLNYASTQNLKKEIEIYNKMSSRMSYEQTSRTSKIEKNVSASKNSTSPRKKNIPTFESVESDRVRRTNTKF